MFKVRMARFKFPCTSIRVGRALQARTYGSSKPKPGSRRSSSKSRANKAWKRVMYMCGRFKPHLRTRARTPARSTGSSASSSRRRSVSTATMGTGQVGPATTATAATGQATNLDGPHSNTKSPATTGVEGTRNVNSQGFRPAREAARFCDFSLQRRKTGAAAAPPYVPAPDELDPALEVTRPHITELCVRTGPDVATGVSVSPGVSVSGSLRLRLLLHSAGSLFLR